VGSLSPQHARATPLRSDAVQERHAAMALLLHDPLSALGALAEENRPMRVLLASLILVLSAPLPADACSMIAGPAKLVSPDDGVVPPGFAVRFEEYGVVGQVDLVDAEGTTYLMEEIDDRVWRAPDDLAPGTYDLAWYTHGERVVGEDTGWTTPADPAVLHGYHTVELVSEGVDSACTEVAWHHHLLHYLDVETPRSDQTGWVVEVEDADVGHIAWLPVDEHIEVHDVLVDAGRYLDAADRQRCLTLRLFDPVHTEVSTVALPCEDVELQGCACTQGDARPPAGAALALLGGVLLLLARRLRLRPRPALPVLAVALISSLLAAPAPARAAEPEQTSEFGLWIAGRTNVATVPLSHELFLGTRVEVGIGVREPRGQVHGFLALAPIPDYVSLARHTEGPSPEPLYAPFLDGGAELAGAIPLPRGRVFVGVRPGGHLQLQGIELFPSFFLHGVVGFLAWPPKERAPGIRVSLESGMTVHPIVAVPFWTSGLSVGIVLH